MSDAPDRRLSVAVITKNEAHRIERCLRSVDFADEIVVVDSGSTDDTVAIAGRLGASVLVTPDWPGFGPQKNRALARCRGRWVLSIDADEAVSSELRASIEAVVAAGVPTGATPRGYWIDRRSRFCGQVMRHGLWRGDRVLRLFWRDAGRFSDDLVHERVVVDGPVAALAGLLHHDSVDSLADARDKAEQYARLGAVQLRARGRGGRVAAWTHGGWTFVRGYLFKLGVLDGRNGFALAWYSALGTYLRYRWAGLPGAPAPASAPTAADPSRPGGES
ncbi:MAG: glycosyltransferase family 2 protein [Lautropia sp.]